jgi:hypothetical protein
MQILKYLALKCRALSGEVQKSLPAVAIADAGLQEAFGGQFLGNATKRLFGHRQNIEQFHDAQAWLSPYKIKHAVVSAAEPELRQLLVGALQVASVDEEQQVHPTADRVFAQELLFWGRNQVDHFIHGATIFDRTPGIVTRL